jgi:hypothetical protein
VPLAKRPVYSAFTAWNLTAVYIVPLVTMVILYSNIVLSLMKSIKVTEHMRNSRWVFC